MKNDARLLAAYQILIVRDKSLNDRMDYPVIFIIIKNILLIVTMMMSKMEVGMDIRLKVDG